MPELPIPKRYVVDNEPNCYLPGFFYVYTDEEVAEFLNNLAPVLQVECFKKSKYVVQIDRRYGYDQESYEETVSWIEEQLQEEFGDTEKPPKPQFDQQ